MTNIEAMKLAIDAAQNDDPSRVISLLHQAILVEQKKDAAMKMALNALEFRVPKEIIYELFKKKAIAALRQAISKAERKDTMFNGLTEEETSSTASVFGLTEQAEQEPVAWNVEGVLFWNDEIYESWKDKDKEPLYTAPPQREWVSLTDDEILGVVYKDYGKRMSPTEIARAIEAKLKGKNA